MERYAYFTTPPGLRLIMVLNWTWGISRQSPSKVKAVFSPEAG
ncbi:hypothetical protein [Rossellomorea marisflavi]|nr:hypothetical protein [Rossellomorea marisflavi]